MKIIDQKSQHFYQFRINYFLHHSYDAFNHSAAAIRFAPTIIIDTTATLHHQFNDQQIKLLNRGPCYLPPCQMYVSSSFVSINDMLQKQYKFLQHHLNIIFSKFQINTAQSMFINKEIKDAFMGVFSKPLSSLIYQRALYKKQLVESIQRHLNCRNLILRRLANQTNVFYLGNRDDFHTKADEFMNKTDIFEWCQSIDEDNLRTTIEYLKTTINSLNSRIETIFQNQKISKDLVAKLYTDINNFQLPYLYFLPDIISSKVRYTFRLTTSFYRLLCIHCVSRQMISI